ncbi:hypothetical protein QQX98_006784 [Neonectria punicea]|uniref:CFEM domain-containing protein n=1 Tax=Neonectria punicea TaxID=979145 RepID=A0ABR1GZU7_9HYPO
MKYAFVALALAAAARAQSRDDIPECAIDCLDEGIESETSCSTTDYTCVCKDFSKVQAVATSCVIDACGADVAVNDVLPAVQALCEAVESGGGESSAAETSAAETSAVEETSSAAAETTSAAAETTTEAAEPTTTTTEAVEETTSEAVEETTSAAAPPAATPNATTPGTSEPTETTVTGAAAALGSIGGLAMLVLAAFAL